VGFHVFSSISTLALLKLLVFATHCAPQTTQPFLFAETYLTTGNATGFVTLLRDSSTGPLSMLYDSTVPLKDPCALSAIDPTDHFLFGVCDTGLAMYTLGVATGLTVTVSTFGSTAVFPPSSPRFPPLATPLFVATVLFAGLAFLFLARLQRHPLSPLPHAAWSVAFAGVLLLIGLTAAVMAAAPPPLLRRRSSPLLQPAPARQLRWPPLRGPQNGCSWIRFLFRSR
jgi:hypothetical protein